MQETLAALVLVHPEHDVAINAERLIPTYGYLVEYEHWGADDVIECCVAFCAFMSRQTAGREGGTQVLWHKATHLKNPERRPLGAVENIGSCEPDHDPGPNTHDFKMTDLRDAAQVEFMVDATDKCWVNLNGKCLLRVGHAYDVVVTDQRKKKKKS